MSIFRCLFHPRTAIVTLVILSCTLFVTYVYYSIVQPSHIRVSLIISTITPLLLAPPACMYFNMLLQRLSDQKAALRKEHSALEAALLEIKTLSGMLPICAHCKKVRDDSGYWNQIETYLNKHSEAELTHSICPECMKEHFPNNCKEKVSA